MEECIDPVFLVSGQQRIDYWKKPAKDQEGTSDLLQLKTGAEDHEDPDDAENTAAAQILLCNNKNIRQREEGGVHYATGSRKLLFFTREVRCQDQDENQFGDLRGLKSEHADAYPGAGAIGRNAQPWNVDRKEQEDPGGIEIFF